MKRSEHCETAAELERFGHMLIATTQYLRAFAISLTRDVASADDLVQETLLKAWCHRSDFAHGTNLKAWLFTILRNTYFSERRKHNREVQDGDQAHASRLVSKSEQDDHMSLVELDEALVNLSAEQREAITLVGAEGFSYEAAARICGCELGTIKSRVNRARCRLAKLIETPMPAAAKSDSLNLNPLTKSAAGRMRS